jgi:hypothetical protein
MISNRPVRCVLFAVVISNGVATSLWAQEQPVSAGQTTRREDSSLQSSAPAGLPKLVKYSGTLQDKDQVSKTIGLTFSIYNSKDAITPLWIETQSVSVDEVGRYTVLLGDTKSEGLPQDVFISGEARWLGVQLSGKREQARVVLVSVPYALKAGDADTLGGKPLSAFLLADIPNPSETTSQRLSEVSKASPELLGAIGTTTGSANFIAKFQDASTIVNSMLFDNGTNLGIGTTSPASLLDVRTSSAKGFVAQIQSFAVNTGEFTGLKLLNGFNGETAKWGGIANVAEDQFSNNSGIALYTNQNEKLRITSTGRVGIGTSTPGTFLEVNAFAPGWISQVKGQALNPGEFTGFRMLNGFNGESSKWSGIATVAETLFSNSSALALYANQAEKVRITSAGGVGIGTTAPAALLDVTSQVPGWISQSKGVAVNPGEITGLKLLTGFSGENSKWAGIAAVAENSFSNNTALGFYANQAERMRLSSNGSLGIGTTTPNSLLDVVGALPTQLIKATQNAGGSSSFSIGVPIPSAMQGDATATSGYVSGIIGTTSSLDGFGVLGENLSSGTTTAHGAGVRGITANTTTLGTGVWGDALQSSGDNVGVFGHSASVAGTGVQGLADATSGDAVGVYGRSDSTSGAGVFGEATAGTFVSSGSLLLAGVYGKIAANGGAAGLFDTTNAAGSILVGRSGANAATVFRVDSTGKVFANGGTATSGADFAESVSVKEERADYEPADIIAIDPTGVRRFMKVDKPYSTLVAGIYSTRPGILATPHAADDPRHETEEIPLAMVGIVPCKVTSENGPINVGDLLVSSSVPGYAMKGTDRNRMIGAVLGKALQSMQGKTGTIEVLVSLQ